MPKTRVFADTNVILEAFRTGCWTAICQHYAIETVEKCIEEALTGDPDDPRRVPVDRETLTGGLAARHAVGKRELASLVLAHPECQGLDAGELHLLAWLHAQGLLPNVLVLVSTADKAAIVATGRLGGLDSLVSLEQLAQHSGVTRGQIDSLARHYRSGWLDEIKFKVRFGIIP
ncbi:hypothetical protein [Burkholderia dolosa]|jgi:hypothetical protein|uniref:hypothetical protein n=1 Tax=Burkholderia dolosa TaxID=152500 RepID=UPI001C98CA80|nr:hypothetical protein [Burkholderia dolosa]MBY4833781.1 hypothetical protein [Burkholderia dolosa]